VGVLQAVVRVEADHAGSHEIAQPWFATQAPQPGRSTIDDAAGDEAPFGVRELLHYFPLAEVLGEISGTLLSFLSVVAVGLVRDEPGDLTDECRYMVDEWSPSTAAALCRPPAGRVGGRRKSPRRSCDRWKSTLLLLWTGS
jgi:hypothetical protein